MFSYCYFSFSILYFKFGSEGIVNCFAETFKRKFDPLHPTDTRRISYEFMLLFCKNYYAVTGIPTNLITEAGAIYSALSEQLHISTESPYPLYPSDYNPEFRFASPDIVYGSVQLKLLVNISS